MPPPGLGSDDGEDTIIREGTSDTSLSRSVAEATQLCGGLKSSIDAASSYERYLEGSIATMIRRPSREKFRYK
jgi:hypothetical protein